MSLRRLSVVNSRGFRLNLPLEDISGGFVVKDIEGLGPVKATLVSSSFANIDGEQYHTSRREPRNIIVKLGLDPDYSSRTVRQLRGELYNFFMPKTEVKLEFHEVDDFAKTSIERHLEVEIVGRIESCEPDIFSREPAIDISIMCFNPDFIEPVPVIFESFTVGSTKNQVLNYRGTVETGVIFRLLPNRLMNSFKIHSTDPDGKARVVDFKYGLNATDIVEINSVPGSKYVRLTHQGVTEDILYAVSDQSAWFELFPGANSFRVQATGPPVPFQIEYTTKHGGL